MRIRRSTKCNLKYTTDKKQNTLNSILTEYGEVVNHFIDLFWETPTTKRELLKPIVDTPDTWLSARLRKVAAREAIGMVLAVKQQEGNIKRTKPTHKGQQIQCSSTIASLIPSKKSTEFDMWLHLSCIGNKTILDLPIKLHQHFHKLEQFGRRLESYIITRDYIQFCFEIETDLKKVPERCVGIDTGIKALATLSTGIQLGVDIEAGINRIKRCAHGSRGQKRAARALRQRMDEVAKEVVSSVDLVVVEKLKGITKNTKKNRRVGKSMRRSIGRWNVMYWLNRLQQACEWNRVSFRTVSPFNTSITCSSCGHVDRRNRSKEEFLCLECGYTSNADLNAARNILERFLTGPYGAGCKPASTDVCL